MDIAVIVSKLVGKTKTPELLADTIVKIYGEASGPAHPRITDLCNLDHKEWDEMYEFLNLREDDDKVRFRILTERISDKERSTWCVDFSLKHCSTRLFK
mgnify:CR=1 FL=1